MTTPLHPSALTALVALHEIFFRYGCRQGVTYDDINNDANHHRFHCLPRHGHARQRYSPADHVKTTANVNQLQAAWAILASAAKNRRGQGKHNR